jgi:hypothetical protein
MNIIIDGQTIVLTPVQAKQFRDAVLKETSVLQPKACGYIMLHCKNPKNNYPLVISSTALVPPDWGIGEERYGRDLSLTELKMFIKHLKTYAAQIWTTAEEELKNV